MTITHRVVRQNAGIVSNHRSLRAALEALETQRRGAHRQGGYSRDVVEELVEGVWVPVVNGVWSPVEDDEATR